MNRLVAVCLALCLAQNAAAINKAPNVKTPPVAPPPVSAIPASNIPAAAVVPGTPQAPATGAAQTGLSGAADAIKQDPAEAKNVLETLYTGGQTAAGGGETAEPASAAEVAERLKARFPGRDYPNFPPHVVLRATAGQYSYRVAFSIDAGGNPREFTLRREIDYADSAWAAERMFLKRYEALGQSEFSTIPESEIIAHARAIHDYNYRDQSFDDPAHYAEMIGHARRQKLEEIANRLVHEEARKAFERAGLSDRYKNNPQMAAANWIAWNLKNAMDAIRQDVDSQHSMDALQTRINALGDRDLFGNSVEIFAHPVEHIKAVSTHGPYTNIFATSRMRVVLPQHPALARQILAEIDRFLATH